MESQIKKNPGVDWALVGGILFWIIVIGMFITIISIGETGISHPDLKISEASASRDNLIIVHQSGDALRFANTKCVWTPDLSSVDITQDAGSLALAGEEIKQGSVSKLEPGEAAKLEHDINMKEGNVGRILILDLMSGQQIFSENVKITK